MKDITIEFTCYLDALTITKMEDEDAATLKALLQKYEPSLIVMVEDRKP